MPKPRQRRRGFGRRVVDALTAGLALASLRVMLLVPYERRIPLAGLFVSRLVAPVAGYRRRIRQNLALALPDLAPEEVSRLVRAVPDNVGRTIAEIWSGREFVARVGALPIEGPGVPTLEAARAEGRPVILAGGHIGNYDAARAALISQGFPMGGLYKPMTNRAFNGPYVRAIEAVGKPLFPRGKAGMTEMVRFLRAGGMLGLLTDQSMRRGRVFTFFGQPALTATSAADLALRYDAPLLTFYGLRQPDGLSFRVIVGGPIPRSDARSMTQALNDDLERVARDHLDQWFWIHRRWKAAGSRRDGGAT